MLNKKNYKIFGFFIRCILKKMKLKDTEMCTFCVDGRDELRHLFNECRFVSYFWVLFSNWWFLHTGAKIVFSYSDIFFGYKITDPPILLNFCILTAKYYIYIYIYISVKYSEPLPSLKAFSSTKCVSSMK